MKIGTVSIATHLANKDDITKFGGVLRRYKIDEIPQFFNVLRGEMSIVGPRPCLVSQHALIEERAKLGVYNLLPGITGLAQINQIDMSNPYKLAVVDSKMSENFSIFFYFYCIYRTVLRI